MRKVWSHQNKVRVSIGADMITNKALPKGIQGQRQLEFRVVVPLEGNGIIQPAVEHCPGRSA
jgi:hypothetical protein